VVSVLYPTNSILVRVHGQEARPVCARSSARSDCQPARHALYHCILYVLCAMYARMLASVRVRCTLLDVGACSLAW